MKIGITLDTGKQTTYKLKYDFYARQVEVADDLYSKLTSIHELSLAAQRIMEQLYNSHGKFVSPSDLEALSCLSVEKQEQATPEVESARPRRKRASVAHSSSESQQD